MLSLLCLLIIVSIVISFQTIYSYPMVNAANQIDRYWSGLTGDHLTPPVNTDARGYVGLKFDDDLGVFVFTVNAENIGNVTGINFYRSDKNQNGTIILDLLHTSRELKNIDKVIDKTPQGKTKGTVSMGAAISDDLQGQLKGKTLSDLHKLIDNGTVFVSIHTKDHPNGEIRGNSFVGIDRIFPDFTDIKWK
jgi:hypothetical protein